LSKGSRRRVLRESAGARSHVDANPEAHGMLYVRVSQLDASTINTGFRFNLWDPCKNWKNS